MNDNPFADEPHLFELVFLQFLGADYLAMRSTNVKDESNFIKTSETNRTIARSSDRRWRRI